MADVKDDWVAVVGKRHAINQKAAEFANRVNPPSRQVRRATERKSPYWARKGY